MISINVYIAVRFYIYEVGLYRSSSLTAAPQGKARRDGWVSAVFLLEKREMVAKSTFRRSLAQFFIEDVADLAKVVMSIGMRQRRYVANCPNPQEVGQVPLPEFPWTRR